MSSGPAKAWHQHLLCMLCPGIVPVLGQFRVDLSDILLEGLDLSEARSGLALGPDGAFLLTVDQLKATVNTRFTYQRTSFPQVRCCSTSTHAFAGQPRQR